MTENACAIPGKVRGEFLFITWMLKPRFNSCATAVFYEKSFASVFFPIVF